MHKPAPASEVAPALPLPERLLRLTEALRRAPLEWLRQPQYLVGLIRQAGLQDLPELDYGDDAPYAGANGMLQIPAQLAACLVDLSRYPVTSYLEVGTYNGVATCFIVAYLQRFNPRLWAVTVDIGRHFTAYETIAGILPLDYHLGTSDDIRGRVSDLCFIDGNHDPAWVEHDYANLGRGSRLCLLHDINCRHVAADSDDGPRKLWHRLKTEESWAEFREYTYHSHGLNVMGLGLRIRRPRPRPAPPSGEIPNPKSQIPNNNQAPSTQF